MKNLHRRAAGAAVLALVAGAAHAELVQYTFTDTNGELRSLEPAAGTTYLNPVGTLQVALSGGIDRKLRLTVNDASGKSIQAETGTLIGAENRITVGGKSYFGTVFNVPTPTEGQYNVIAEVLSSTNAVVQKDTYQMMVDVTPPTVGDIAWDLYYWSRAPDGIMKYAYLYARSIKLLDVKDSGSGVVKSGWDVFGTQSGDSGKKFASGTPIYNSLDKLVSIGSGQPGTGAEAIRTGVEGKYNLTFTVSDAAGNQVKKTEPFYDNSYCTPVVPKFLGIFDPDATEDFMGNPAFKGFVAPVGGVTVVKEPISKTLWRHKRNRYPGQPGAEVFFDSIGYYKTLQLLHTDEEYAYFTIEGVTKEDGTITWGHVARWNNGSTSACGFFRVPAPAISNEALPPGPASAKEFYVDDWKWIPASFMVTNNIAVDPPPKDRKMSKVRLMSSVRPYPQIVSTDGSRKCTIPAGENSCIVENTNIPFNVSGQNGGYGGSTFAVNGNRPEISVVGDSFNVYWDAADPVIKDISRHDTSKKEISFVVYKHLSAGNGNLSGNVKLTEIDAYAISRLTGVKTKLNRTEWKTEGMNTSVTFSYGNVPDGEVTFEAFAKDYHNNSAIKDLLTFQNDALPPTLSFNTGSSIASLDEIVISVADNATATPTITTVNLKGGPTNDDVFLSVRGLGGNRYALEYPVMFPSLAEGEGYTLTVGAKDDSGNTATARTAFLYEPARVSLANDPDGNLMIPAVQHAFKRPGNGNIIETNPLTYKDGSTVSGTYPVSVMLRSDATVPLVIQGVTLNPGETKVVIPAVDFASSGGRISLSLMPAQENVEGTSRILVTTAAPNAPIVIANVGVWKPAVTLQKSALQVLQGVQPVSVKVSPAMGSRCRITLIESEAMGSDVVKDPVCLLQWDKLPAGVEPSEASLSAKATSVDLVGQLAHVGEHPLSYSLFMFDMTGQKVLVASGSETMTATTAMGSVSLAPATDVSTVNRLIQDLSFKMSQASGTPSCTFTMIEQRAKNDALSRAPGTVSQQCYFEWLELPEGLAQDAMYDTPQVRGVLADKKSHDLKWRLSLFTRTGEKVVLNEQTYAINAIDPLEPALALTSKYQLEGSEVVVVPMSESSFGLANISAVRSTLDIEVTRDAEVQATSVKPGNGASAVRAQRVLQAAPAAAWTVSQHKVRASYNLIPEVFSEKALKVYLAPSLNIKPMVSVESSQGIDSIPFPVKVAMFDRTKPNALFEETTMGKWKARLVREMAYNKSEPLTEFADITDGFALFNVDLSKLDATSMRFNVEAVLESPVEGYARTEVASRSTLVSIVRGGLIEGTIKASRLSGQAPFKTSLKLGLTDTKNTRYTGAVKWEVSTDGGANWEAAAVDDHYKFQFTRSYDLGTYKVRANITNAHSGVAGYTEAVEVVAYLRPKAFIAGARSHFVGSTATMQALLKSGDVVLNTEDYEIEWSVDGGTTFTATGAELALQETDPKHIKIALRAKPKEAPEGDRAAFHLVRSSVDFLPVKPPRPYISAPLRMEKGKTYTISAKTTMPYQNMSGEVKGYFTLPNGQQVEGETTTYMATEEDLQKEFVETKYTAWIDGFRERGAEASSTARSRTWEYIFPNFGLEIRRSASVSPATVTAILRPIGFTGRLEDPTYTWTLPEGTVVLEEKPTIRVFKLNSHGVFSIKVTIGDARGNQKVLEQPVVLGEPNPYKVDLQHSASNAFNREPLDVQLRPYVTGGHPLDRVASATYFVNGEAIEATSSSARATLSAGDYAIRYVITSRMGADAAGQIDLTVQPNKPPVCKVTERATIGSRVYNADCTDPDGRVKLHEWTINGQVAGTSSSRLSVNLKNGETAPNVVLVAIDDAGARSAPVTAQPGR